METILLIGSLFNFAGGMNIFFSVFMRFPMAFPEVPGPDEIKPADYMLFRFFTAGTAFTFGSIYLYLFYHPQYAVPFLIFGMALKYWAFIAAVAAYQRYRLPKIVFVNFGLGNLMIAILFSVYLILS